MRSTPEFAYLRPGDTCDTEWRVSGSRRERVSGPEDLELTWCSSEPEPTQERIGFLGKLLLSSQLCLCVDTRDTAQTGHCQTGNLNRPLIVLTRSSWINIVDLVKLPKHQPSLIRPLVLCCGCQPGVMPTQFNRVILWRMGWEEFAP